MNHKKSRRMAGRDRSGPGRLFKSAARLGTAATIAFAAVTLGPGPGIAAELPRDDKELLETIRTAIDRKDYDRFDQLVYWEGAGKIKRRIVAFEIRRGLGRKIASIAFEDFPKNGMAGVEAMEQLHLNMPVTHRVRVTYDEPPIDDTGKLPTSVFLVGQQDGAYRIALVVRNFDDDDD